ncbi:MAG: proline--tRNA ligase [Thermoplasmata archaeon]|nr:proline--tRNA ligase [Thermoplasmata archaeon]
MAELPDKAERFIDWYLEAVEVAGLTDKRYPVKGMNVWTPYGFQARRLLDGVLIRGIEATGSQAVEFPTLIPRTEFQKEKQHVKGFDEQVYWVTRGGATELDVPLVLRPTSETAMYPIFAIWIRSHRDLPLNVYQIVNVFRYETKTTRPFLRIREIHFFEEHTCQLTDDAAAARCRSNLDTFHDIAEALALPYVASRRPEWDKFPGAFYSIALDLPVGGARTLQVGTIHHYRENFSRPYEIRYEDLSGALQYVHQTTFGLSERLLGATVAVHGDRRGVVFPSSIAPYQVVIVPIVSQNSGPIALDAARALATRLRARDLRVHVDDSPDRPGAKYYLWESRGVPLRIEIGPREAAAGTVTAVNRLGEKKSLGPGPLEEPIIQALADFDTALSARARATFQQSFSVAHRLEELANSTTVRLVAWCGAEACGHQIEQAIEGAVLGVPEGPLPIDPGPPPGCIACGKTVDSKWALAGRPL